MSGLDVTGLKPKNSYKGLLRVNANTGLAASAVTPVGDSAGNDSPLQLSQTAVNFDRSGKELRIDGVALTATAAQLNAAGFLPADFFTYLAASILNVTGNGDYYDVGFDTETHDPQGCIASGVYTAPATGTYDFSTAIQFAGMASGNTRTELRLVISGTSARTYIGLYINGGALQASGDLGIVASWPAIPMTLNDTAHIRVGVYGGTKIVDVYGEATTRYTWFAGGRRR